MRTIRSMFRLDGKVAIVTGGATGLGRAAAGLYARAGADVLITGRRKSVGEEAAAAVRAAGGKAEYVPCDVSKEAEVAALVRRAVDSRGRIDILVNNAGVSQRKDLMHVHEKEWDDIMDINLKGVFFCAKHVLPTMIHQKRGVILNVASYLGRRGGTSGALPVYNASKGGVIALSKALAVKHGPEGIRVIAICPAFIETDLNRDIISGAAHPEDKRAEMASVYPLRRLGTPEDFAHAALYLASDEASWVTGIEFYLDGGLTAK